MERRHLTLMFTDIVGYSRLMGQNEAQCIAMLGEYRRILLAQIEQQGGTVIEFIGDAVFARFDTPQSAVQAGIDIQKDLGAYNLEKDPTLPKLQSRIGIHSGEVNIKDDALFGDDVNIAARLEPIAVADGLCISDAVYQAVKGQLFEPTLSLGTQPLKNIESKKIKAYLVRPAGITLSTHAHYWLRKTKQKIERYRYPLTACLLAIILAGVYFIPRWLVPGYTANYVEIADFKNLMSEDGSPDYFSAGITEALRSQLADMRDIYILEAGKGVRGPIRLEGSVQKIGEQLRIAYRLFRRKDNVQIAGGKLDGAYKDIFILQDRVVAEIAGYLASEFNIRRFRPAAPKLTSDITAYDYYLQGLAFLNKPNNHDYFDEAIKLFSTALVHDKNFAKANAGLCSIYRKKFLVTHNSNWAERAEEYCQLALRQDDSLTEVYQSLGDLYRDTGRHKESMEIFQKAISIDDNNIEAKLGLASVYKVKNEIQMAEEIYMSAVEEQPKNWKTHQDLANFYAVTGKLSRAIDIYKQVLKITPENEVAYSNMGAVYFYLGNYNAAAESFDSALVYSQSSWAYSNTGTMYYFSGNFSKSAEMFRQAIKLSPDDYRLYGNLADAMRQLGKDSEAKENYRKTIDLALEGLEVNDKDPNLYQNLALSYFFEDDVEKAEINLKKATDLAPNDIDILYTNVKLLSLMKQEKVALEALKRLFEAGYSQSLVDADPDLNHLKKIPGYDDVILLTGNE